MYHNFQTTDYMRSCERERVEFETSNQSTRGELHSLISEWTSEPEKILRVVVGPALVAVPRHADKRQPYKEFKLLEKFSHDLSRS